MRMRLFALSVLAATGFLSHTAANAEVLRCSDAAGKTLYTDSARPAGMHAVGATSLPQACTTEDCDRRREREVAEARERIRAEKEELAIYTAARHQREIEDRRLDEARFEAGLRSAAAAPATAEDVVYPAYPVIGFPSRCGKHCLAPLRHHHVPTSATHSGKHDRPRYAMSRVAKG